jgi:hypothetical protein
VGKPLEDGRKSGRELNDLLPWELRIGKLCVGQLADFEAHFTYDAAVYKGRGLATHIAIDGAGNSSRPSGSSCNSRCLPAFP